MNGNNLLKLKITFGYMYTHSRAYQLMFIAWRIRSIFRMEFSNKFGIALACNMIFHIGIKIDQRTVKQTLSRVSGASLSNNLRPKAFQWIDDGDHANLGLTYIRKGIDS